jgi:hypothetical protein
MLTVTRVERAPAHRAGQSVRASAVTDAAHLARKIGVIRVIEDQITTLRPYNARYTGDHRKFLKEICGDDHPCITSIWSALRRLLVRRIRYQFAVYGRVIVIVIALDPVPMVRPRNAPLAAQCGSCFETVNRGWCRYPGWTASSPAPAGRGVPWPGRRPQAARASRRQSQCRARRTRAA